MKVTDLMIGDWVNYSILNLNAKVFSILGNHTIGIQFVDKNNKVEAIHGLLEETINPIPLTESILVKNGFEKRYFDYDFSYDLYEDDNVSFVRLYDHGEGVFFTETSGGDIVINYVHQLQRLLRLCNIDKEIIL